MLHELDTVVLTHDLDRYSLREGDVGAVVYCYGEGEAYEVEFVTADGETLAVVTLTEADIRPMHGKEILHVRALVSS